MSEVVVIGAGVGGLSAAIACAARGHRVRLVEAAPGPGGKAGRVRVEGATLDTGPSVLTLPEIFDAVLALAGEPPLEVTRPARFARYRFADGAALETGRSPEELVASTRGALGARAAAELERFLEGARSAWEVAAPRFVLAEAPTLRSLLCARPWELRAIRPFSSLWDWISRDVRDERLRALLARFATYAGSDARRAPAVLGSIAWVELGLGGFGVRGGIHRLVDRLAAAALRLGVELRYGAPVAGVEVARGQVRGVALRGGERLDAEAVICNAEARLLFEALLPAGLRRAVAGEPSYSGDCLLLRAPRAERPAHDVLLPARYLDELEALARGQAPADPTVTVCAPRVAHEAPSWEGADALFCMVNAPAEGEGRDRTRAGFAAAVRARLATAGIAPADAPAIWQRDAGELSRRFPGSAGSLYGSASHSWRAAFLRPPNRVASVRGLYLASGSAHPGAGLPLVASSGLRAAEALDRDLARSPRPRPRAAAVASALACALFTPGPAPAAPLAAASTPSEALPRPPAAPPAAARAAVLLARAETSPAAAREALRLVGDGREPDELLAAAEAAFRLASAAEPEVRRAAFEEAIARSRLAATLAPRAGGAWFWLAISLSADARERGLLRLWRVAPEVRDSLERAARLDPGYEHGAPLAGLCALYHRAPGPPFSFGDEARARRACLGALREDSTSWEAHLVLAEQAREAGHRALARTHLHAILDGPTDERLPRTQARYREDARNLLEDLRE